MNTYRKALALLTAKEKRRGALVLCMVVITAILETVGVASVDAFILALGAAAFGLTALVYAFLLNRRGGDMAKNIFSEGDQLAGKVFRPCMYARMFRALLLHPRSRGGRPRTRRLFLGRVPAP